MKKLVPLLIIGILVFSGFGASAYTNYKELNNLQIKRDFQNDIMIDGDELDQYQLVMDEGYAIFIGEDPDIPYDFIIAAQEFIPTKRTLTRVELLVCKDVYTTYHLTVAIKNDLRGPDLISISKNSESIPTGDFTWIEFDFDDIEVIPGFSYYIVCSTVDAPNNRYYWGVTIYDLYPNGSICWSEDGQEWYFDSGVDTTFKTYGFNNLPPSAPTIDGPNSGKFGTSYTYTFTSALDPDGDDISYFIDWDDGTTSGWTSFIPSGPPGYSESHTWTSQDTYTIRAKVKDAYGAESDWGELTVTMLRIRAINGFFLRFLEQFPLLQKLLLLQR